MAIGKITSKSLAADAVTSANLAPGAVTISDIPDGEITADKLNTTLDLSTKTLTLTQASVTAHESALSVTQSQISDLSTTSDLTEGTNLYYTDARADARAQLKVDALVGAAPGTLDTLEELGDALGDDPNFATTVTNSIATKLPLAGGTLTGNLNVTGTVTSDGLTVDGNATISSAAGSLYLEDNNYTSGQKVFGVTSKSGDLFLRSFTDDKLTATNRFGIDHSTGDISFYEATGTTAKFFWDASTERLGIGTDSPEQILHLKSASNQLRLQDSTNDKKYDFNVDQDKLMIDDMTAGVNRLTISGNNVGIGTTDPNTKLHTYLNSASENRAIRMQQDNANQGIWMDIMPGNNTDDWQFGANDVGLVAYNTTDNRYDWVIDGGGNVGIGTSSPSKLFEVSGPGGSGGTIMRLHNEDGSGSSGPTMDFGYSGQSWRVGANVFLSGDFAIYDTNNTSKIITINPSGNVGIGTTSPESKLNIGTPDKGVGNLGMLHTQGVIETQGGSPTSMTTTDGNNGILWRHDGWGVDSTSTGNRFLAYLANSDASLIFANNNFSPILTIAQNGNVGIGTTSPDTKLEIVSSNPILTLRDTSTGFNNGDATLRLAESGTGDVLGSYFDVRLDASMLKFDFTPEGGSSSTYMSINSSDGQTNFESTIQVGNSAITAANAGAGTIKYDGTLYFSDGNDWKAVSVSINDGSSVSKAFDDLSEVAGIYSSDVILYTTVQGYESSTLQYTVDFTDAANPKYQATNSNSGVYDTNGTFSGCSQGTGTGWTVWEAAIYCMRGGARLCSRAELDGNVVGGSGCSHDNRAIWTYTTDGNGNFYRGAGINSSSTNEGYVAGTNTSPSGYTTNEIGIRCCGTGASGGALWEI
jgi:hypothetical protein